MEPIKMLRDFFPKNKKNFDEKSFLITGGTGSFGQEFIKQLIKNNHPERVIVFSRDEQKQFEMQNKFSDSDYKNLRFFIGDVRDCDRLELAMSQVDYVIHAAAIKHVPTAEYNPFECIKTNVYGAENIVRAAIRTGVKRVVALSTDKAANPINLYGASKLASDKIFIAGNNLVGDRETRFSVVRYGNVLGSRGSVIPFFRDRLARGAATLPITHPDMTRFWITLRQGANFVLSSLATMRGGEIFAPKIPSMRIVDLAKAMAPDARHEIVGIRPGEKLHETIISADDSRTTYEYDDRYVIAPMLGFWRDHHLIASGAKAVDANFIYSSERNAEWLSGDDMLELMRVADV